MSKRPVGVLFDLDGTLLNSIEPQAYAGVREVFRQSGLPPPDFVDYVRSFGAPYLDYYRDRGVTATAQQIYEWYHSAADHYAAELFPDSIAVCTELDRRGVILGLVSGQREAVVRHHLLNGFGKIFGFVVADAQEKVPHISWFCRRYAIEPSDVWYVGDFVSDMRDARKAGVRAVGITRGFGTRDALVGAGADCVIEHLPELL